MNSTSNVRAQAREDLCRFLAACYYEPTQDFAQEKLFESMAMAAETLDPEMAATAKRLGEAFATAKLQDLLVDYTRLFLGPVRALAMPYGSIWLGTDATVMQEATAALQDIYAEGGFELGDDFPDLPDHIAVELEFLYALTFRENQAIANGRPDEHAEVQDIQQRFLREHFGTWVSKFADAVMNNAETNFYRELAGLTLRFLNLELKVLRRN